MTIKYYSFRDFENRLFNWSGLSVRAVSAVTDRTYGEYNENKAYIKGAKTRNELWNRFVSEYIEFITEEHPEMIRDVLPPVVNVSRIKKNEINLADWL